MLNRTKNEKNFSTGKLDDAMKELLDVCQQYNDKFSIRPQRDNDNRFETQRKANGIDGRRFFNNSNTIRNCDIDMSNQNHDRINGTAHRQMQQHPSTASDGQPLADPSNEDHRKPDLGSIERLQQRQCELQEQLDTVLQIAKDLELRQKKKFKCILEEAPFESKNQNLDEDEDEELIGFQQIENELRMSELNRQLSDIQEELRLRLYKRLLTSTTNGQKMSNMQQQQQQQSKELLRRNSSQMTDESTPPSSSCSDEHTAASSSSSSSYAITTSVNVDAESAATKNTQPVRSPGVDSFKEQTLDLPCKSRDDQIDMVAPARNPSDLERIEEDEEDIESYYCDSNRLRTIYEEKLSPIIRASNLDDKKYSIHSNDTTGLQSEVPKPNDPHNLDQQQFASPSLRGHARAAPVRGHPDSSNVNMSKRSNRPLTMYLPKPDEEIDLIDHVHTLGHDLSILADDLKVTQTSARGYLYKSSSSNKKWLKRYFYFDRASKSLAYYENEAQLVKKSNVPKSNISFEEIRDVYVDHRLSQSGDKERTTKKVNYVFVLATIKRKYNLACPKAEVMRAWIDILYTAAKANDLFQHLTNSPDAENYDFQDY